MATRKNTSDKEIKKNDALIIEKSTFTSKLLERIDLGKELLNRQITNLDALEKNKTDYRRWDKYNLEFLKTSFNNEINSYRTSYDRVNSVWLIGGSDHPSEQLKELRKDIQNKIENLESLVERVDLLKSEVETFTDKPKTPHSADVDNKSVFIVHGHNIAVQQTVARAIEKLGLHPIILHEKANAGKTIIEKFETHSNFGFAIVLLTDDDEGKSKTDINLAKRARQNVILELGFFIGKLGRARVLPLYSEGVELPSDINGLLYVPLDKAENWKFSIVRELKEAGYNVDANKLL